MTKDLGAQPGMEGEGVREKTDYGAVAHPVFQHFI